MSHELNTSLLPVSCVRPNAHEAVLPDGAVPSPRRPFSLASTGAFPVCARAVDSVKTEIITPRNARAFLDYFAAFVILAFTGLLYFGGMVWAIGDDAFWR